MISSYYLSYIYIYRAWYHDVYVDVCVDVYCVCCRLQDCYSIWLRLYKLTEYKVSSNYQWFNKFDWFETYSFLNQTQSVLAEIILLATATRKQGHCLLVSTSTSAPEIFHDTAFLHVIARCICWKRYRPRVTSRRKKCAAVCGRKDEFFQPSNGWFCNVSGVHVKVCTCKLPSYRHHGKSWITCLPAAPDIGYFGGLDG